MFERGRQKTAKRAANAKQPGPANSPSKLAATEAGPRPVVVFVLFETQDVSLETIEPALARQTILGKRAIATPLGRTGDETNSFATEIGDAIVAARVMPTPYPVTELDFAITTSWTWPPERESSVVRTALSHVLLVVTGGKGSSLENHLVATAVAALIAGLPGAIGVYWPAGSIVHFPPIFTAMAPGMPTPGNAPLSLWVNFCVVPAGDGSASLFTKGLAEFDLMEMEIHNLRIPEMALREWAGGLASQQLIHGQVLQQGDVVGEGADAQLRVSHEPSSFGLAGTVLHLRPV